MKVRFRAGGRRGIGPPRIPALAPNRRAQEPRRTFCFRDAPMTERRPAANSDTAHAPETQTPGPPSFADRMGEPTLPCSHPKKRCETKPKNPPGDPENADWRRKRTQTEATTRPNEPTLRLHRPKTNPTPSQPIAVGKPKERASQTGRMAESSQAFSPTEVPRRGILRPALSIPHEEATLLRQRRRRGPHPNPRRAGVPKGEGAILTRRRVR